MKYRSQMRRSQRSLAAFGALIALMPASFAASPARAEDPPPPDVPADEGPNVPARPLPRDDRTGHFIAFAGLSVVVPAGDLGAGSPPPSTDKPAGITLAQVAGPGIGAEAGLGVGVARHGTLDVRGQLARFEPANDCQNARRTALGRGGSVPACSAQMFAADLGLTYHTSQALGFDPWVRYGVGYRAILVNGPLADIAATAPATGTFHGIDVANITMGGDFYPATWFGLGFFLSGVIGIEVAAPSTEARGAVYGLFQAGLRIALDPQRKAVTTATGWPSSGFARAESSVFSPALYNPPAR
ncbi:MAG: hypothetical protein U0441_24445 [Polyangiaceae bacterium]